MGVNRTGNDPHLAYAGGTVAYDPEGDCIGELTDEEGVLSVPVSPEAVHASSVVAGAQEPLSRQHAPPGHGMPPHPVPAPFQVPFAAVHSAAVAKSAHVPSSRQQPPPGQLTVEQPEPAPCQVPPAEVQSPAVGWCRHRGSTRRRSP